MKINIKEIWRFIKILIIISIMVLPLFFFANSFGEAMRYEMEENIRICKELGYDGAEQISKSKSGYINQVGCTNLNELEKEKHSQISEKQKVGK